MLCLVRFGEIHLKSRYVRKQFQDKLVANIQDHFAVARVECLTSFDRGRIYIETEHEDAAMSILKRVFGVVSFSPVVEYEADVAVISERLVKYAAPLVEGKRTFAIRSRRVGTHDFTSIDVAVSAGKAIQEAYPSLKVDLDHPDLELFVEVRQNRAFLFHEVIKGPGGLPLGSQGRMLALVDNERGMIAAWMMMKRGCRVTVIATDGSEWIEPLRKWDLYLKVQKIGDLEELREISKLSRADALTVGWTLDEVEAKKAEVPEGITVFHPTVGLNEDSLRELVERIRSASFSSVADAKSMVLGGR